MIPDAIFFFSFFSYSNSYSYSILLIPFTINIIYIIQNLAPAYKVKKLTEKPDKEEHAAKLSQVERQTEVAKQTYEKVNEYLCHELPQVIYLCVPYLDPSFEALSSFSCASAESYSRMAIVQQCLKPDTR